MQEENDQTDEDDRIQELHPHDIRDAKSSAGSERPEAKGRKGRAERQLRREIGADEYLEENHQPLDRRRRGWRRFRFGRDERVWIHAASVLGLRLKP